MKVFRPIDAIKLTIATVVFFGPAIAAAAPIAASAGPGLSAGGSFNRAGTGWVVDDGSFPAAFGTQEVIYDPTAGPWDKILAGTGGGTFTATDTDLPISVTEFVTIAGAASWNRWHETIAQTGWRWIDDRAGSGEPTFTFASGAAVPGLAVTFTPPLPSSGGQVDFTFDPLPPGTHLKIVKRLVYDGADPLLPGEVFAGKLDLFEYPAVPEPTTLAMAELVIAVSILVRRSKARRHTDDFIC